MVVTETYKNNAIKFKEVIKKAFGLSKDSYERICSYIDDPTLLMNDKTKELFAKYDDEIVDYRIPVETEKLLRADTPIEIYYVLEALNDVLFDNFEEYRTLDNNCDISTDNLLANKFVMFGQNRKLWKFLCSYSEKIAKSFIGSFGEVSINSPSTEYSFGPLVKSISKYSSELGTRNTSLKTKIEKLFSDNSVPTRDLTKVTAMVNDVFRIVADIIGAKSLPNPYGYKAYLSYNMCDWLLASSGEDWESCISLHSGMCYGLGLTGPMSCPDWGMLEIAKNSDKEVHGIKVPHVVCRTWTVFGNNDKFNIVNWYPHDIRSKTNSDIELKNKDIVVANIRGENTQDLRSSSWYKPFYMENGAVPFIYSDCYGFKLAKSGNSMRLELTGEKCGIFNIFRKEENGEDVFVRNGNGVSFGNICGAVGENRRGNIDAILRSGKNLFEFINYNTSNNIEYEDEDEGEYCDWCEQIVEDEEFVHVNGVGHVCMTCIDESGDFFYCEDCEEYHRSEDGFTETTYGTLVCNNCRDRNYTMCDECGEWYINDEVNSINGKYYCDGCVDEGLANGTLVRCDECEEIFHSEYITKVKKKPDNEIISACSDCREALESKNLVVGEDENIEEMKEVVKKQNEEASTIKEKSEKEVS